MPARQTHRKSLPAEIAVAASHSSIDYGALSSDSAGNLYGTTAFNGAHSCGTVFELAHNGNQWAFNLLWTFTGYLDGCSSFSGVIFDQAGNLYGTTTEAGADDYGNAFELSPSGQSWSFTPLHQFVNSSDGSDSNGNLIFDSGDLFGTNRYGGPGGEGGIFELSPSGQGWNISVLHSFHGEAAGPDGPALVDSAGNLYATSSYAGRYGWGNVFKMTPSGSGYTYTDLYDFTGGSDGGSPSGQIVMDASGNLFGTTEFGGMTGGDVCGTYGCGVVWEITPQLRTIRQPASASRWRNIAIALISDRPVLSAIACYQQLPFRWKSATFRM